jgi:hypothetical protein
MAEKKVTPLAGIVNFKDVRSGRGERFWERRPLLFEGKRTQVRCPNRSRRTEEDGLKMDWKL